MFGVVSFVLYKINARNPFAFWLIKKRSIIIPPNEKDFESLDKVKQKQQKHIEKDKKGSLPEAQLPVKVVNLEPNLAQYVDHKFEDFILYVLSFVIVLVCFGIGQVVKMFAPDLMTTSFIFYTFLILWAMLTWMMWKDNMLPFTFNDEQKILCLFFTKFFIISFAITTYFETYFDFKFTEGCIQFQEVLDQIFNLLSFRYVVGPQQFSVFVSILSGAIAAGLVDRAIKFSYHFHTVCKNEDELRQETTDEKVIGEYVRLKMKLMVGYFIPIVIIFLHVPSLSRDLVVGYITQRQYEIVKTVLTIVLTLLRTITFHDELQFRYNEGYLYVQRLVADKSEKLFRYVRYRLQEGFTNVWKTAITYIATIMIPLTLAFAILHRQFQQYSMGYAPIKYDFESVLDKAINSTEGGFTDLRKMVEAGDYSEVAISAGDSDFLSSLSENVQKQGFMPLDLQISMLEYLVFIYYTAWLVVSFFAIVYYRKYKSN